MNTGFRKSSLWIGKANGENIFTKTQKNIAEKLCNYSSPKVLCELYIFDLRMFLYGTNYTAKWLQPTVSLRLLSTINSLLEILQTFRITVFQGERRRMLSWCCFIPTRWCCFCFLVKSFILEHPHFSTYQENTYSIYISFYMDTLGERAHCGGLISSHSCQKLP